jgi:membrane protein DedA with SNARE-associated domain
MLDECASGRRLSQPARGLRPGPDTMHELFAALASWVTATVQTGGYVGVAGLTLLENVFPPIPSELILPVAGFLVGQGRLTFGWVVAAATLGSLLGALGFYGLGYWLGERRLRALVRRHGHWLALDEADVEQAVEWFARHGGKAVLLGRLAPSVRSMISVPAGLARMPLGRFVLYTTLGSGTFNAALVAAGWLLGDQWERVKPFIHLLEWAALAALVAGLAWFVRRRKGKRASRPTALTGPTPDRGSNLNVW